jgi:uncharacterized surface protein with fasciclin (FAS1) repeats
MSFQEQTTLGQGTGPLSDNLRTVSILETLEREGFGPFAEAARNSGLETWLQGISPITLFVPSNTHSLDREQIEEHIVEGRQLIADLHTVQKLRALSGSVLSVEVQDGNTLVEGSRILRSDIACTNGVIQVIERALTEVAA